jgi:hypothetical protein
MKSERFKIRVGYRLGVRLGVRLGFIRAFLSDQLFNRLQLAPKSTSSSMQKRLDDRPVCRIEQATCLQFTAQRCAKFRV